MLNAEHRVHGLETVAEKEHQVSPISGPPRVPSAVHLVRGDDLARSTRRDCSKWGRNWNASESSAGLRTVSSPNGSNVQGRCAFSLELTCYWDHPAFLRTHRTLGIEDLKGYRPRKNLRYKIKFRTANTREHHQYVTGCFWISVVFFFFSSPWLLSVLSE